MVWTPGIFHLLDGLRRCGESAFVSEMAERFCNMVQKEGCAENFDALTGRALRDKAYTWTGSAMLVMAHEFLDE